MKVLIDGTGTRNKGAELMLLAILEMLKEGFFEEKTQFYFGRGDITNTRLSELQVIRHNTPQNFKLLIYNLPFVKIPERYNVDLVLDASGFRYGDFWVQKRTLFFNFKEYLKYRFFKKIKAKVIFLPQAFGPFCKYRAKLSAKTLVKFSDLIIARDEKSYSYIKKVAGKKRELIKLFPDFTNLLEIPFNQNNKSGICIIPNTKINQKFGDAKSSIYFDFLRESIHYFLNEGEKIYLLNHSNKEDLELCNKLLFNFSSSQVELINIANPIEIKEFIQNCRFVISSRFHGIINSLSQGIPTVCVGWSHKYEYLLKDYSQSDALITISTTGEMLSVLKKIYNRGSIEDRKKEIFKMAKIQKEESKNMWLEVKYIMLNE